MPVLLQPVLLGDRRRSARAWLIFGDGSLRGILSRGDDDEVVLAVACDRRIQSGEPMRFAGLAEAHRRGSVGASPRARRAGPLEWQKRPCTNATRELLMYRKSERTPRRIRRDFPHFVEIEIPGSGLRGRVALIHGWLDANAGKDNYAFTRRHERGAIREWLQVRFKEPALADAFRQAFASED